MLRYFVALVAVLVLTTDVSACSRAGSRARNVLAMEARIVTAPARLIMAPIVTRERHRVVTRGVVTAPTYGVVQTAPVVVKCPCPAGGCPLATPPKTVVLPPKK